MASLAVLFAGLLITAAITLAGVRYLRGLRDRCRAEVERDRKADGPKRERTVFIDGDVTGSAFRGIATRLCARGLPPSGGRGIAFRGSFLDEDDDHAVH